jgi:hypothetical protein
VGFPQTIVQANMGRPPPDEVARDGLERELRGMNPLVSSFELCIHVWAFVKSDDGNGQP